MEYSTLNNNRNNSKNINMYKNNYETNSKNNSMSKKNSSIVSYGGQDMDNTLFESLKIQNDHLKTYFAIIILGYFGVKIVYGLFFNFYPEKYYHKNIYVTTNEEPNPDNPDSSVTNDIILNAFVPGLWNNEIIDFITMIILTYIIYVFTNVSNKSYINKYGNVNITFIIGYILGLGYPPIYSNYIQLYTDQTNQSSVFKYMYLIFCAAFIVFVISMNYLSMNKMEKVHKINYTIYLVVLTLIIFGLVISKKNIKNYSSVTQFNAADEKCSFSKNGVYQTSGDNVKFTVPLLVFVILLLFSYEPKELSMKMLYVFVYGLLLGVFVSSVSYYGIEYFLEKSPIKQCNDINECKYKDMPLPLIPPPEEETQTIPRFNLNVGANIQNNITATFSDTAIIRIIIIVTIVSLGIYLIYFYLIKGYLASRKEAS